MSRPEPARCTEFAELTQGRRHRRRQPSPAAETAGSRIESPSEMRPVSVTTLIDVPRERVFDLLWDLSVRPAFTDHFIDEYRLQRVDPVGVGAAARFRMRDGSRWMDTTIVAAERPHLVREAGSGGRSNRIPVVCVWELAESASPTAAEVTVTFWTEPVTVFDRLRERLLSHRRLRRDFARALARLRRLAEDGGTPERVGVAGGDRLPAFVQ
jgi:hypothetical protein